MSEIPADTYSWIDKLPDTGIHGLPRFLMELGRVVPKSDELKAWATSELSGRSDPRVVARVGVGFAEKTEEGRKFLAAWRSVAEKGAEPPVPAQAATSGVQDPYPWVNDVPDFPVFLTELTNFAQGSVAGMALWAQGRWANRNDPHGLARDLVEFAERTVEGQALVAAWRETTRIYANPELLKTLTEPLDGDFGQVPEPAVLGPTTPEERALVDALRTAGRTPGLTDAVWSRLQDQQVLDDPRLQESLRQMRRGEPPAKAPREIPFEYAVLRAAHKKALAGGDMEHAAVFLDAQEEAVFVDGRQAPLVVSLVALAQKYIALSREELAAVFDELGAGQVAQFVREQPAE